MFHSARRRLLSTLLLLIVVAGLWPAALTTSPTLAAPAGPHRSSRAKPLPLRFVRNAGQRDPAVRFEARSMGGMIFFTPAEVVLALPIGRDSAPGQNRSQRPLDPFGERAADLTPAVVRLRFDGANPAPAIVGVDPLAGSINYLIGSDPATWRTKLQANAGLVYQQLYPGIDLRYDGLDGQLKGTYLVASGADPLAIRWRYQGAETLRVDRQGNLEIALPTPGKAHKLVEAAPVAWQDHGTTRRPIAVSYDLAADGSVGFTLGDYDRALPLVIDPTLSYSTYLGGIGSDTGFNLVVDSAGNAYIVGETLSYNYPTKDPLQPGQAGGYDVVITKLNPTGDGLLYSTYLGGNGDDRGRGVALDATGAVVVTGSTTSFNFPTKNAVQTSGGDQDGFVARLQPDGAALSFSTYLGGFQADSTVRPAIDAEQNIYVTGATFSSNFPTTAGAFQTSGFAGLNAYVAKLPPEGGRLLYSTLLSGSGDDAGYDVVVDATGAAHVVGRTTSTNFPLSNALQPNRGAPSCFNCADLFVTQLSPAGNQLGYSTYLGGSAEDAGYAIALDAAGAAYVTGTTASGDFPKQRAVQPAIGGGTDAFIAKLAAGGTALSYSTYLGGSGAETGLDLALDGTGGVSLIGETSSLNLPLVDPIATSNRGGFDVLAASLSAAGDRWIYSSYLGGSGNDHGRGIAVNHATGATYLTGETLSANFPTCTTAQTCTPVQQSYGGNRDAFLAVLVESQPPTAPANLRADNITGTSLTLSWDAATDNIGVVEYAVYQDGVLLATTDALTLAVSGLSEGASYGFTVTARDAAGNVSAPSAELIVGIPDLTAPVAPTDLAVVSTTDSTVRLVWAPATDNVAVTGYNIYSGTTLVGSTTATVFTVTGLVKNRTYTFTIKALDAAGNLSAASNAVTAKAKR